MYSKAIELDKFIHTRDNSFQQITSNKISRATKQQRQNAFPGSSSFLLKINDTSQNAPQRQFQICFLSNEK